MSILSSQNGHIGRIPYDIWYAILKDLDCLPTPRGFPAPAPIDRYRTHIMPLLVSHVCQSLRSFALSTPSLWTRISMRIGDHPVRDKGAPHTLLMELFLQRSRDKPLFVTLSVGNFDLATQREEHRFLVKLFANAKRWKEVKLELDAERIDEDAWRVWWFATLARVSTPLDLMTNLELRVSATSDPDHKGRFSDKLKLPIDLWKASPLLTHLAISVEEIPPFPEEDGDIVTWDYMDWTVESNIPYTQITHLLLEGGPSTHISWPNVRGIFRHAPNLIVCFLEGICAHPNNTIITPVVLPHLLHLYLEASGLDGTYESLTPGLNRVLTAPALKTLSIAYGEESEDSEGPNDRDDWEQGPYTQFIIRSSCSLEELRLIKLIIPVNQLLECMELSPTLKVLHTSFEMDMDPINEFTFRIGEQRAGSGEDKEFKLCPRLDELGLYDWDEIGELFSSPRILTPTNEETAEPNNVAHRTRLVAIPDPYYEGDGFGPISAALQALSPAVRNSERVSTIYQFYLVNNTIRRSLWNRFRFEDNA